MLNVECPMLNVEVKKNYEKDTIHTYSVHNNNFL